MWSRWTWTLLLGLPVLILAFDDLRDALRNNTKTHELKDGGEGLRCEKYNPACTGPESECPTSVLCPNEAGKVTTCMAVWTNFTSGPAAGTDKMLLKGCWHQELSGSDLCDRAPTCTSRRTNKHSSAPKDYVTFFCCCTQPDCNGRTRLQLPPTTEAPPAPEEVLPQPSWLTATLILLPILGVALLVAAAYWLARRLQYNAIRRKQEEEDQGRNGGGKMSRFTSLNGSASVAHRPIQPIQVVARGRYGQVYEARWGESIVAVKVFPAQDVDSWMQEQDIYAIDGLKNHENVLRFHGAEEWMPGESIGDGTPISTSEYWLITEYHPRGSLSDYLKAEMLRISVTMLRGLAFLHEELEGLRAGEPRKPTIVHRDFKSKNILLKADLTACVADFGLAMRCTHGRTPEDTHGQVGTRRYMAPEVLEGATEFTAFAFRQIDVYAAALVLWECLARARLPATPPDAYKLPFEEEAGTHPTLADMQNIVVQGKRRPTIREGWRESGKAAAVVVSTMEEMWDTEPEARITSGCAVERLAAVVSGPDAHPDLAAYCAPKNPLGPPEERQPLLMSQSSRASPPSHPPDPRSQCV